MENNIAPVVDPVVQTPPDLSQAPAQQQVAPETPPQAAAPSWEELTGGRYKSLSDIDAIAAERDRIAAERDAALSRDPFHNEFSKILNDAFGSGKVKSIEDAARFVNVQFLDIDKLSARDAIVTKLQLEKNWSPEKAQEYYDDNFSAPSDDDLDFQSKSVKLKWALEDAQESAKGYLKGLKVDPETLKLKEQPGQEAQPEPIDYKAAYNQQAKVVEPIVKAQLDAFREHTIKVQKDGKDYYQLSVPVGVSPERINEITQEVTYDAIASGIDPVQGAGLIQRMIVDRVRANDFERVVSAAVLDMEAEVTKAMVAKFSNSKPPQSGSGQHHRAPSATPMKAGPYAV